ncbi:NitT/TauT family transport system permease protein [Paenibacillus naphthalenovorans]|nr:NitT/TauT family transport system permease protein [Paenibacillus naphthalenovorans]
MKRFVKTYYGTLLIVAAVLAAWIYFTDVAKKINPVLFPNPQAVLLAFWKSKGLLLEGFISSMQLFLSGYFSAVIAGIAVGLAVALHPALRKPLMPIFHALSPIPPTMYIPYAIALLPTFKSASVFLIFASALWPILLGTIQGVLLIDRHYLDNARALGLRSGKLLTKVIIPAALPFIFNGAGVALGFAFIILTVAEMFGAKSGMGYFIQYYSDFSDYKNVVAGMIFNSLVILAIMLIFDKIKNKYLFWTQIDDKTL